MSHTATVNKNHIVRRKDKHGRAWGFHRSDYYQGSGTELHIRVEGIGYWIIKYDKEGVYLEDAVGEPR